MVFGPVGFFFAPGHRYRGRSLSRGSFYYRDIWANAPGHRYRSLSRGSFYYRDIWANAPGHRYRCLSRGSFYYRELFLANAPPGTGTGPCHGDLSTIGNYSPPFKNLKINGRIIGDFDILFCQRKCQKWNIRSLNLSKKLVVTRNE